MTDEKLPTLMTAYAEFLKHDKMNCEFVNYGPLF